jgi:hypothetical protein
MKPSFILFWKDSIMHVALVLRPICVPEKAGIIENGIPVRSSGLGRDYVQSYQ